MKIKIILLFAYLACFPLNASEKDLLLNKLFNKLQFSNSEKEYEELIGKIWDIWLEPNDLKIEKDFKIAISLMNKFQYEQSIVFFSRVIEKNPSFAEAWNKRATSYYIIGDYEKSLSDIKQTLVLEPRHFGAMDGLGLILIKLEKFVEALKVYEKILEILPYSKDIQNKIGMLENITTENI